MTKPPSPAPPDPPIRLRYIGPFAKATGYAQAGHDYLAALHAAGVELDIWPMVDVSEAEAAEVPEHHQFLFDYVNVQGFEPTHVLVHGIPTRAAEVWDDGTPDDVPICMMTTWETSKFPGELVEGLNEFDLTIVPCRWNEHVLRTAGVENLSVVPHTYHAETWQWAPYPEKKRPFVFYTVGVWGERENLAGLLKAYLGEFHAGDDVILRVCLPFLPMGEVSRLAQRMAMPTPPRVEWLGHERRLTSAELRQLHVTSHCYVSATRGEAWGLGAFEATLTGRPVIMPGSGGELAFLSKTPHGFFRVRHQKTPVYADPVQVGESLRVAGLEITPQASMAPIGIRGDQHWAEPDLHELQFWMRDLYEASGRGQTAVPVQGERDHVAREFAPARVALRLIEALRDATAIRAARLAEHADSDKETP